jgi:hypothetical protein
VRTASTRHNLTQLCFRTSHPARDLAHGDMIDARPPNLPVVDALTSGLTAGLYAHGAHWHAVGESVTTTSEHL